MQHILFLLRTFLVWFQSKISPLWDNLTFIAKKTLDFLSKMKDFAVTQQKMTQKIKVSSQR